MRFCRAIVLALFLVGINGTTPTIFDPESRLDLRQQHNLRRSLSMMAHKSVLIRDRFTSKTKSISEENMVNMLPKSGSEFEAHYAGLFQLIKDTSESDPEVRRLAERLQNTIFQRFLEKNQKPWLFGEYVGPNVESWKEIFKRGWADPYYKTLEAYTVAYATKQGGEALRSNVQKFFFNVQPYEAVMTAQKQSL
ncbi:unnamed protein product [Phytophthora fragariaefolia]|uniref:Unnamed protein product n=1 Tax=Phytophthora fragariaefolia TaxID=1490495 RepID=A0A9W7D059_9STRA|nr:unnamed protein product [Phytophthora fragariaefolia]